MGTYVYTARATGRVKVKVNGGMHWVFQLKFSFKPCYGHPSNDRWMATARRTAENVARHPQWEGYVNLHGRIYMLSPTIWFDSEPFIGRLVQ